jgi:hypothetical protein
LKARSFEAVTDHHKIALVIVIRAEAHLKAKNRVAGETFLIPQQDRARLWMAHPGLPSQTWIWTAEEDIFDHFTYALRLEASKDGYQVDFMQVLGTDNLNPRHPPYGGWQIGAELVADVSRRDVRFGKQHMELLAGFSQWVQMKRKTLENTWRCDDLQHPDFHVYLVLSDRPMEAVSSTRLRKALKKKEGEELVEELKRFALSSRLLVSMIHEGRVRQEEKEAAKLKGDKELQGLVSE